MGKPTPLEATVNQALDATIDEHGNVRLLQPIQLSGSHRAVVVILPEPAVAAPPPLPGKPLALADLPEPRDDWERRLRALAVDCGVSPPHSAFSSDELYE